MMKEICRNTISIGLAVLLVAGICGISQAQPDKALRGMEPALGMGPECRDGHGTSVRDDDGPE